MKFVLRSFWETVLHRITQKVIEPDPTPDWFAGPFYQIRSGIRFVYIHGFNSHFSPDGEKIHQLSKLAPVVGLNYDSFETYDRIMDSLEFQVEQLGDADDLVFIGTSLGAFFASELGRIFGRPSIIINPCTKPYAMLGFALHIPMKNFVTGVESSFTMHAKSSYLNREISTKNRYSYPPLLLVDLEDELLPANQIFAELSTFPKVVFDGGCHRFSHMEDSLVPIGRYINHCESYTTTF